MDVDSVSGSERDDEVWEDVDEIRRCYNCGLVGHIAREGKMKEKQGPRQGGWEERRRLQRRSSRSVQGWRIPRTMDMRSDWTPVSSMSMESGVDEEDADCRNVLES